MLLQQAKVTQVLLTFLQIVSSNKFLVPTQDHKGKVQDLHTFYFNLSIHYTISLCKISE